MSGQSGISKEIHIKCTPRDVLNYCSIFAFVLICSFALYSVRWVFPIAFIGLGFGVILAPLFEFTKNKLKIPKPFAAVIFVLLFVSFVGLLLFLLYGLANDQLISAQKNLPSLVQTLKVKIDLFGSKHAWLEDWTQELTPGNSLYKMGNQAFQGMRIGVAAITGFILVLVIALYTAVSPSYYFEGVLSFVRPQVRIKVGEALTSVGANLRRWFSAQLIAIASVETLVALGLCLIGLDYWLLLGLLSGLLDIIPYIGSLIPAVLAILIALGTAPGKAAWVLVVFILVHQFENNLLIPLVMRYRMHFPPVTLLIFMLMMATWFGVVGILMTPGIFTVLRTLYLGVYAPWINRTEQ